MSSQEDAVALYAAFYVALYTGVRGIPWGSLHQQVVPLGDAALLLTH
jgi:hypothetical protein